MHLETQYYEVYNFCFPTWIDAASILKNIGQKIWRIYEWTMEDQGNSLKNNRSLESLKGVLKDNKRPTALNDHLIIRDSKLTHSLHLRSQVYNSCIP